MVSPQALRWGGFGGGEGEPAQLAPLIAPMKIKKAPDAKIKLHVRASMDS